MPYPIKPTLSEFGSTVKLAILYLVRNNVFVMHYSRIDNSMSGLRIGRYNKSSSNVNGNGLDHQFVEMIESNAKYH